ncbi:MAG TPA: hypothetical protein VGF99_07300, partial [Myxococcota bacterium]
AVPASTTVARGDVVLRSAAALELAEARATNAWRFTAANNAVVFCNVQFPNETTTTVNVPTQTIYGRYYDQVRSEPGGFDPGVKVELGVTPELDGGGFANPASSNAWTFKTATFNVQSGNDDEYEATLTLATAGRYRTLYRVSFDDGLHYTYCGIGGNANNAGVVIVNP